MKLIDINHLYVVSNDGYLSIEYSSRNTNPFMNKLTVQKGGELEMTSCGF